MKSLREVMDGMDWSGWATKPHGPTQLPQPTADNYSRPVEGEGMSETERRLRRLIVTTRATVTEMDAAIDAALMAAEARGFARAREKAARLGHNAALASSGWDPLITVAANVRSAIIAMRDEGAGDVEPKDQMVAAFRSAADALETWHVSGSPFISRRDNNWVFEAYFRLREICTRITSNYGDTAGKEQG